MNKNVSIQKWNITSSHRKFVTNLATTNDTNDDNSIGLRCFIWSLNLYPTYFATSKAFIVYSRKAVKTPPNKSPYTP